VRTKIVQLKAEWAEAEAARERGEKGMDTNPKADGAHHDPYIEHYELQPIDAQTNGPQLYYGLRYHTHILQPGGVETVLGTQPAGPPHLMVHRQGQNQRILEHAPHLCDDHSGGLRAARGRGGRAPPPMFWVTHGRR